MGVIPAGIYLVGEHRVVKRYNPNQPRAPRGNERGGEWVDTAVSPKVSPDKIVTGGGMPGGTQRAQTEAMAGPTPTQAKKMAVRLQALKAASKTALDRGDEDRAIDLDMEAWQVESDLNRYDFDPTTGKKKPGARKRAQSAERADNARRNRQQAQGLLRGFGT